jgi:hypothetical protein
VNRPAVWIAAGVALTFLAAWLLGRDAGPQPEADEASSRRVPSEGARAASAPPALRGAPEPPATGITPPAPSPVAEAPKRTPAERVQELIARIKQEVEPASWLGPDAASIAAQGESLVVRAHPDVQGLVARFLSAERDRARVAAGEIPAPTAYQAVPPAQWRLLLGRILDDAVARRRTEPTYNAVPWRMPLGGWKLLGGPAVEELRGLLRTAGARPGASPARRGAERDLVLQRGSVSLRGTDLTLGVAVARLAVDAFVDIQVDERVASAIEDLPLGPVAIESRSLAEALDDVVARVPGHVWRVTPLRILITRADLPEPPPVTEIHSVADLVAGGGAPPVIHLDERRAAR